MRESTWIFQLKISCCVQILILIGIFACCRAIFAQTIPVSRENGLHRTVIFKDVTALAGINFVHSHNIRSLEETSHGLYPEDVGSGACFTDYDNDGDLDLYVVNNPGPLNTEITKSSPGNVLYQNNGDGTFADVTTEAGVGDQGFGMGCVSGDYDNDGNIDLYITNYGPNILYRNNGDGTFADVTTEAGVGDPRWSTGATFGDYDNDGNLDLYVPNYLDYDLRKLEAAKQNSIQYGQYVPSALNPVVFDPQDNMLYRNNGNGTFTDVTSDLGVEDHGGRSFQALFTDLDLDGDLDIYIANDLSPNTLYRNDGNGIFTDVSNQSWAADVRGSMGLTAGDYDNDGDLDIFMSHWMDQENAIYRNLWREESDIDQTAPSPLIPIRDSGQEIKNYDPKNWTEEGKSQPDKISFSSGSDGQRARFIRFVDESYNASLGEESLDYVGWGTDLFDYDLDGFLDIFVVNGHTFPYLNQRERLIPQADQLFRNTGDGIFTDVTESAGIITLSRQVGRGAAFGDYDNDGDVDIFIVNNHGPGILLRNEGGNRNNWLQVKLIGTTGNRDAVGAKIWLKTSDLTQFREINAGSSFLSCNSLTAEFGLGSRKVIDSLEVVWLNGMKSKFRNINANQRLRIVEGQNIMH